VRGPKAKAREEKEAFIKVEKEIEWIIPGGKVASPKKGSISAFCERKRRKNGRQIGANPRLGKGRKVSRKARKEGEIRVYH
jgi:hypothetical protein